MATLSRLAGKPTSAYRPYTPQPARRRALAIARPPLSHFVILSMLLHALAIALFGAPSGGSREGRALWGSLQVMLPGSSTPTLKLDRDVAERPRATMRPPPQPPVQPEASVEPITPPVVSPRVEPAPADVPLSIPPLLERLVTPER